MARRPPATTQTPAASNAAARMPTKPSARTVSTRAPKDQLKGQPRQRRGQTLALAGISDKLLLSIPHAAELLDMGARTLETMLARGEIQGLRVGARHMVPRAALDAWLARQVAEQIGDVLDA